MEILFIFLGVGVLVVVVVVVVMIMTTMIVKDGSTVGEDVMLEDVADDFLGRMVGVMGKSFKGLVGRHEDGVVVLVVAVGVVEQLLNVVVLVDDLGETLAVFGLFDQFVDGLAGVSRGVVGAVMAVVSAMVTVVVMIVVVMLVILVEGILKFLDDVFLDQRGVDGGCGIVPGVLNFGENILSKMVLGNW